jgi:hypothetical protein
MQHATKVKMFKLVPGDNAPKSAMCNENKLPDFVALRNIPRFCLEITPFQEGRIRDSLKMLHERKGVKV